MLRGHRVSRVSRHWRPAAFTGALLLLLGPHPHQSHQHCAMASMTTAFAGENATNATDAQYPGTALKRLAMVHERVKSLTREALSAEWEDVRRSLLWAGGLKDLPDAVPGQGYTGHSFNDFNHCDLTTMLFQVADNEHDGEKIPGIARGNFLGDGIRAASLPLGEENSGSWSTCMMGCNKHPPVDVAHVQFRSRIAFKLVWCPDEYEKFVLVDDAGTLLAVGTPKGQLPSIRERQMNFQLVIGSKYSHAAEYLCTQTSGDCTA